MRMLSLLALAFVVAAAFPAAAKTYPVPEDDPSITVTVPPTWKTEVTDDGVEATSPDGNTFIAVEELDADGVAQGVKEGLEYLEEKGIKIDPATQTQKEDDINGMKAVDTNWKATSPKGAMMVSITIVIPSPGNLIMLTVYSTEAGFQSNGADIVAIAKSLQATKK